MNVDRTENAKIYSAKTSDCKQCPIRGDCLSKHRNFKTVKRPIHQDLSDKHHEYDATSIYREVQRLRRTWCEGSFGLMKEHHNLRSTYKKGITNLREHCLLSALAVNLKRNVKAR
jgi:hypothetical protein